MLEWPVLCLGPRQLASSIQNPERVASSKPLCAMYAGFGFARVSFVVEVHRNESLVRRIPVRALSEPDRGP